MAAIVLARAGADVTVVEQQRFPRDKVCGECLSALAVETLERLELAEGVRGLGPAVLRGAGIYTAGGGRVRLELPRAMWGISRYALDDLLLKQAVAAGAKVLQPSRCEGLNEFGVRVRDLQTNEVHMLEQDWVVVADGKIGLSRRPARPTSDFGIKAHFENVDGPGDAIELFGVRGAYGGLAAIEGGKWNAAFSVPGKWLKELKGNVEGLFARICQKNATLGRRVKDARRVGEWLAAPLPRYGVRREWAEGVVPVGNAAAAIEPIGGEGMGLAMASGELGARFILGQKGLCPPTTELAELYHRYERLWRVRRAACRLAGMVVARPWAANLVLPLLNVVPGTRRVSLWLLGKGWDAVRFTV